MSWHLYTATYRKTRTAASDLHSVAYWPALAVGGTAQLAAVHCPNERTFDFSPIALHQLFWKKENDKSVAAIAKKADCTAYST